MGTTVASNGGRALMTTALPISFHNAGYLLKCLSPAPNQPISSTFGGGDVDRAVLLRLKGSNNDVTTCLERFREAIVRGRAVLSTQQSGLIQFASQRLNRSRPERVRRQRRFARQKAAHLTTRCSLPGRPPYTHSARCASVPVRCSVWMAPTQKIALPQKR